MSDNFKTISGVDFEAVRVMWPIPHWRAKVLKTGFVFNSGCFDGKSRPRLWESIERIAKIRGESFETDCYY